MVRLETIAHLARVADHHDVALGDKRNHRYFDQRLDGLRRTLLGEELHEGRPPGLDVGVVLDVGLRHVFRRLVHVTALVHDAPEIEHQLLVVREDRIAALQHRQLIGIAGGRDLRHRSGHQRCQQQGENQAVGVHVPEGLLAASGRGCAIVRPRSGSMR